jgi:hypothetical protein
LSQEKNRLEITPAALKPDIDAHIAFLEGQVKSLKKRFHEPIQAHDPLKTQADLLVSIVGIGPDTAARLLAEMAISKPFVPPVSLPPMPG